MRTLLLAGLALVVPASARAADDARPARVVYLDFSDGGEGLTMGPDHPAANTSSLCAAGVYGRWNGTRDCHGIEPCKRAIADQLDGYWADLNVTFTLERPSDPPYDLVMIGPASGSCAFGVDGLAPLDCQDSKGANVSFVFECHEVVTCARIISQELAHSFGLAHTVGPCDIMSGDVLACDAPAFQDLDMVVVPPGCGPRLQNSHALLVVALGPWPLDCPRRRPWDDPPGGCSHGGHPSSAAAFAVAALCLTIVSCGRLRRVRA